MVVVVDVDEGCVMTADEHPLDVVVDAAVPALPVAANVLLDPPRSMSIDDAVGTSCKRDDADCWYCCCS